jgi:hypothetical protein
LQPSSVVARFTGVAWAGFGVLALLVIGRDAVQTSQAFGSRALVSDAIGATFCLFAVVIGASLIRGWRAGVALAGIGSALLFLYCVLCLVFGHEDIGRVGVVMAFVGLGFSAWSGGVTALTLLEREDAA